MKNILFFAILILLGSSAPAQTFSSFLDLPPGLRNGDIAWADFNNDEMLDFIQVGDDIDAVAVTRLYKNTGTGFVEVGNDLPKVYDGSVAWGDYDNDGDQDLLIMGYSNVAGSTITQIYDNNNGSFTLNNNILLAGVSRGSVDWGDYDNDGNLDILLTGQDENSNSITKIYKNGSTTFAEVYENLIVGVSSGDAAWGDYDSDGDLDIMISGITNAGSSVTSLYENTGTSFTEVYANSFEDVYESSFDFGDYDNDGDLDILLTGFTNSVAAFSAIYQNNGTSFDIVYSGMLPAVLEGKAVWGDADNDGDLDIFISGSIITNNEKIAALYTNDGAGFALEFSFNEAGQSSMALGDFDADGNLDFFLSGQRNDFSIFTTLYENLNVNVTQTANPNTVPIAPLNLVSQVLKDTVLFNWDKAADVESTQATLTYNIFIRNGADTIVSSQSLVSGKRELMARGNTGHLNSYSLFKSLEPGDYFWRVQTIDNSFAGSSFSNESTFHINFPPIITEASSALTTPEETPLLITLTDLALVVVDPDNTFPDDYALAVNPGNGYALSNNQVTPDTDYNGSLIVPVSINDGFDDSPIFNIVMQVTAVNDPPVITAVIGGLATQPEMGIEIVLANLEVSDPDNTYPNDFTLTVMDGSNYSVSNNLVTPIPDFIGSLTVPVLVNDGTDDSPIFNVDIEVTLVAGLDLKEKSRQFSIFPNPANERLNINIENNILEPVLVQLISLRGKVVSNKYFNKTTNVFYESIDVKKIPTGLYFLKISQSSYGESITRILID